VIAPAQAPEPLFPDEVVSLTQRWLRELALSWHQEVPIPIHSSAIDASGSPAFHPNFISYIERDCRKPSCTDRNCRHGSERLEPRKRAKKALGRLRRAAPREFDAVYLHVAHQLTVSDIARAMTGRARGLGKPEIYDEAAILVLLVSGIDKIQRWY
jgi:hypothetical protein